MAKFWIQLFLLISSKLNLNLMYFDMEASEPNWVNSILNIIGVNSLKLGGLHVIEVYS